MRRSHILLSVLLVIVGLTLTGCSNPTSPSGGKGVRLSGVALGPNAAVTSSSRLSSMADGSESTITVTVEGTSISTTISGNGTFELEGLPSGSFTLVFTQDGVVIGTVSVNGVPEETEIKVVVQIKDETVILIKLEMSTGDDDDDDSDDDGEKTCAINGGKVGNRIELEGNVSGAGGSTFTMLVNGNRSTAEVNVDASGASFKCNGKKDKSGEAVCDATSLSNGAKVHVSGTLTTCSLTAADVTATKVMIQKGGSD
jgi:hypothetical protein